MMIGNVPLSMFLLYVVIGFFAQCIDGTLGMAYGVSCRTFLKSVARLPAAMASAVVHCAEMFTTLVSGISHLKLKNVIHDMLWRLIIPGVIGGALGAWFLSSIGDVLEPAIDLYLIVMGVIIFLKVFRTGPRKPRHLGWKIYPLGFAGGFLDATGGGGWGPVVTSTLLASDQDVKKSIGTVNTAEFVVTVAETTTFVALVNDMGSFWPIILGVALGGVIAAPLAAYICKKVPVRPLLAVVGLLIIGLNIYNLIKAVPAFVALLA